MVHISSSPAYKICCNYGIRKAGIAIAEETCYISNAAFPVPDDCVFFRLTVTDMRGKVACTNAYFV